MESNIDKKLKLIEDVNSIIHSQSIKRDDINIQNLREIDDSNYTYLTVEEQKIFKELIKTLIKFYNKDDNNNPKLLSDNFFENIRISMLKQEEDKDVRIDGTLNPELDRVVEKEQNKEEHSNNSSIEISVDLEKNEPVKETSSDRDEDVDSKSALSENSNVGSSQQEEAKPKSLSDDSLTTTASNTKDNVTEKEQNKKTDVLNKGSNEKFNDIIEDLKEYHKTSLEKSCELPPQPVSIKTVDCNDKEQSDKIKKEMVDDFALFLNSTFDEEMVKLSTWEDTEDAERFRNYYQMYNLKMVNYLINKYNME